MEGGLDYIFRRGQCDDEVEGDEDVQQDDHVPRSEAARGDRFRNELATRLWKQHTARGYEQVVTGVYVMVDTLITLLVLQCPCGKGHCRKRTSKTSKSYGRSLYVCPQSTINDFLDASYRSAASQCSVATGRRDSPDTSMHVGILSRHPALSRLHVAALRCTPSAAAHVACHFPSHVFTHPRGLKKSPPGTQTIFHEELSSSGRLEDGKKVQPSISRTIKNATAEGDTSR
ncbi:hypothetical protein Taro_003962 [Colocasia esculenta]|uniref:Uncharacterized protein n=1 Tax=Colocasia esculenta TaxID=4460 RepID=A0A843TQA4_COLES|nr:hypothetical protein [Colocasia esculenta]